MIKEFFLNDDKMSGFFLGAFLCAVGIALLSGSRSTAIQQDGLWTCEVRAGRTQCADMKAFTAWWDNCRKKDYQRWPMANAPDVAFGESLRKKYGDPYVK